MLDGKPIRASHQAYATRCTVGPEIHKEGGGFQKCGISGPPFLSLEEEVLPWEAPTKPWGGCWHPPDSLR